MKIAIAALVAAALVGAYIYSQDTHVETESSDYESMFMSYCQKYGKSYSDKSEYVMRLHNFIKAYKFVSSHSSNSYSLAINHFADWTDEEFNGLMGFVPQAEEEQKAPTFLRSGREGERSVDWRDTQCVEHVKDQGSCGSCYSFAATGAIEVAHCVATGELIDLADKDCMDCSFRYKNKGCNGG